MKKIIFGIFTSLSVLLLTGCLIPEKFSASVKINADGSYSYRYEGITVFGPALMEMAKSNNGGRSEIIDKRLQQEAIKFGKTSDVEKSEYVGNGRLDLRIAGERKVGQSLSLLDALKVSKSNNGELAVSSVVVKPNDAVELKKLGLKLDGKLEVTLPKNAEVIYTNATSKPGWFTSTYTWKVGSIDERPEIRIRLKP